MLALLILAAPLPTACEGKDANACARHLLAQAYGPKWSKDDLELDPPGGTKAALAFEASQLEALAKRLEAACPCELDKKPELARALEWARRELDARFSLMDPNRLASIEPELQLALAGEPLKSLDGLSALSLWRIRNAVFARHGKRFDHPDLVRFFYGPSPAIKALAPKEGTFDLSATDKANIALVQKAERAT